MTPYHPLIRRAMTDPRIDPVAFLVLAHLVEMLEHGPKDVYQDALALSAHRSRAGVRYALHRLAARQYIVVVGRGPRRSLRLALVDMATGAPCPPASPLDGTQRAA